jgi:septal ring-binding cell division protein DamX
LLAVLGVIALAAIGAGAWFYLRGRAATPGPPPTTVVRAAPTTTTPATMATEPTPPPVTTALETPRSAAPPTTVPARSSEPVTLAQARTLMRQGQLPQAARGFAGNVRGAPSGTLSVQLLVACAPETVQKALDGVPSDELFILPVHYNGRDCFRMCWGLYPTPAKATSAMRALPEYFRAGGAKPKVAPVASLLP